MKPFKQFYEGYEGRDYPSAMEMAVEICDEFNERYPKGQGSLSLRTYRIDKLPPNMPAKVVYRLDVSENRLTSLEGCTQECGSFDCRDNQLTTLEGGPQIVNGHYECRSNKLTNLIGAPREVRGDFICAINPLTSLEGAPEKITGTFYSAQFTHSDYLQHIQTIIAKREHKAQALHGSNDEAGLGDMLDVL